MKRLGIFAAFVFLSVLAAGLFGIVHDQISYTVSHEYFTKFKFIQFRLLDADVPERVRAGWVGFLASWWMGIPLGLFAGAAGFVQRTPSQMRRALLWSLPLLIAFTLSVAIAGLVYGVFQTQSIDFANYRGWYLPVGLEQPRRFLCAGYMHNSAYLGGVLAIPVAWIFNVIFRWRGGEA
jgi:hypothetical protein